MQGSIGCAVAGEAVLMTAGAPAGRGDRRCCAQVSERRIQAESVDILACGDERSRGVVGAASQTRHGRGCCGSDEPAEAVLEFVGLGTEATDAAPQAGKRCFGDLGGTVKISSPTTRCGHSVTRWIGV